MSGDDHRKSKSDKTTAKLEKKSRQMTEKNYESGVDPERNAMACLQSSMNAIHADIKAMRSDVRTELEGFKEALSEQLRNDMSSFKEEVDNKLTRLVSDLQRSVDNAEQTEQRVADVEEWGSDVNEIVISLLQDQEKLQEQVLDLQTRSRRLNLRLYNVAEDSEKNDMMGFINNFIKTELSLDIDLGIQRCHRSLVPKPPPTATPRSIVMCFLEDKTKELVRNTAWKKKTVLLNGKRVYFDNDYPQEIQKKRQSYAPIRHLLKDKGIAFHTPPLTKLRVFYEGAGRHTGPGTTYNSMEEARDDLKKRGLLNAEEEGNLLPKDTPATTDTPAATNTDRMAKLKKTWTKVGRKAPHKREALLRATRRLQEFRRTTTPPPTPAQRDDATT